MSTLDLYKVGETQSSTPEFKNVFLKVVIFAFSCYSIMDASYRVSYLGSAKCVVVYILVFD